MKKVLLLCTGAYHTDGGIAAVNRLTIQAVLEAGYGVDVIVLPESESQVDERRVHPTYRTHFSYRTYRSNKYAFTLAAWRAVISGQYNLILVDHVNLAYILVPFRILKRCRYTVWLCGIEVFPPRPDFEGRLGLLNASKRLAISGFTQKSVTSRFPNLSVMVCDLALDPVRHPLELPVEPVQPSQSVFLPAITGEMIRLGDQVILHVGRMVLSDDRYKGQESLLQAFPLIRQQYPQAQLVLIGQGEDMSRIRALADSLPVAIQAGVFMPGYIPDQLLDQIYRSCYVFAMPSIGEGFGLVYLEAMSRGKPCLGGKVDATPYVVRDGETGLLVDDPRSPEQVAEKIIWLMAHPEQAEVMGRAGYELVRTRYLFPHFQERFWRAIAE